MTQPFWRFRLLGQIHHFGRETLLGGLAQKSLEDGRTFLSYDRTATLAAEINPEDLVKKVMELCGAAGPIQLFIHRIPNSKGGDEVWMLGNADTVIVIDITHKSRLTEIAVYSLDKELFDAVSKLAKDFVAYKETKGKVYILVQDSDGPEFHELGHAGETFEPGNYEPAVVEHYRHVIQDLNSSEPCGRVIILDGPPGTGKTHMIRAMLEEVPKATFVLVQANMVSSLGNPTFVRALMREMQPGRPIIILVEDADECLASRKADNQSDISALLNFGDGIFGVGMDLRIVATTNRDLTDLDGAVTRPRRLCRRIEVGFLNHEQAEAVYRRLVASESPSGKFTAGNKYTLAEVYQAAHGGGEGFTVRKEKRRAGFFVEAPPKTPAEELGLKPGDVISTDDGEVVHVRSDGQLEDLLGEVRRAMKEQIKHDNEQDADLIDEDPED